MSKISTGAKLRFNKKQIVDALKKHDGMIVSAAKELGVTVQTIINYINRYEIDNNAMRVSKRLADLEIIDNIIRAKAIRDKQDRWLRYLHEAERQSLGYSDAQRQRVEQTVSMEAKVEVKHELTTDERLAAIMALLNSAGTRAAGQTDNTPAEQ